ncbi:DNA cytosine methyltransferase, partial [Escherichia coli]|uniref:DNA cytosine methyltransferase n=1 Tax=Escherichia coli TaxID=562 RepID=UPI001E3E8788
MESSILASQIFLKKLMKNFLRWKNEKISNRRNGREKNMRFLDVFSGIGGFRMGLENSGHTCI